MGLKDKLTTQGSKFTYPADGTTAVPYTPSYVPPVNPLATQQSKLHADAAGTPGYSLNGNDANGISNLYNQYKDGISNTIPLYPNGSGLDLNGGIPPLQTSPVQIGQTGPQALPYINNQPN
jgi:hypothetical protein